MTNIEIERQAWLIIAEAYAKPYENRTGDEQNMTELGCCNAMHWVLSFADSASHVMRQKIEDCGYAGYFCPAREGYLSCKLFTPEHDLLRADFCYLMAFSCEDE